MKANAAVLIYGHHGSRAYPGVCGVCTFVGVCLCVLVGGYWEIQTVLQRAWWQ